MKGLKEMMYIACVGEKEAIELLEENGYEVRVVADDPKFYYICDLIAINPQTKEEKKIEVKADNWINETGNLFVEIHTMDCNEKAWFNYCKADLLFYYDTKGAIMYYCQLSELHNFLNGRINDYPQKRVQNYNKYGFTYDSVGALVPISELTFMKSIQI